MNNTWLVITLSLGSAFGFAVSTNLKHAGAAESVTLPKLTVTTIARFVRSMASHPLWLLGIVADSVGLVLQVLALHLGALAVVQPLLVSGLLFSVALRYLRADASRRSDLGWAAVLTASLAGFILVAGTGSGVQPHDGPDRLPAVVAALIGAAVAVTSVGVARRLRTAMTSAALLGVAVGLLYAADAALLKTVSDQAVLGLTRLITCWQLYAVIVVGVLGLVLTQLAYQSGPLTASLPAMSAVDPLASIAIGVLIFDEHVRRGPWTGALLAVLLAILAVSILHLGRRQAEPALSASNV
ncbi:MAG: hypothetical protein JWN95_1901 [Frankiales bacterium]|nr:hypothetical protein [Frankiales bacterium]